MTLEKPHDLNRLKINWQTGEPGASTPLKNRKIAWFITAGGILLLLAGLAYFYRIHAPLKVEAGSAVSIFPSQAISLLNASGYVVARQKASIASKGTGRLVYLKVKEGDAVKKGEILARLENGDVLAALARAEAGLNVAKSSREQALAELNDASLAFQRSKSLLEQGMISKAEYDTAQARLLRAEAALNSAEAGIKVSEASIQSAEVDVENTIIRAPFDGAVLAKNAEVGEVVAPFGSSVSVKSAVLTIADLSSLEVEADVSESNIEKIYAGQPCEITLDAYREVRYQGVVQTVVPTADRAKATILTKIRILNPDRKIFPEMSAKVSFLPRPDPNDAARTGDGKPFVALPASSVLSRGNARVVFLIRQEKVIETPVETGRTAGNLLEVVNGIQPGDRVVLHPDDTLKSGTKIEVLSKE